MTGERRLRVAMVLDWFFYYAAAIANELSERCDTLVVTRDHGLEFGVSGSAVEAKRRALLPAVDMQVVSGAQGDPRSLVSALVARRRVAAFRPDVVHTQDHSDWRLLVATSSARGARRVLTIHDIVTHPGSADRLNGVQRLIRRRLRDDAAAFIVHGDSLRTQLRDTERVGERPVFSIPHGVLCQPSAPRELPDEPRILFFGRMEPYKGIDDLVAAARIVRTSRPDLRVLLAGRGAEATRLAAETAGDPTFEWIDRFITDDELPDLFARALFVVMPYREASQSGVVPLAFASGRTVVATRVGALAEAVSDGETGLLCEPGDVEGLARAMIRLIEDRAMLEALSSNAEREVRTGRLSVGHVADLHIEAYAALAGVPS